QIGDCGFLETGSSRIEVRDCKKQNGSHLHVVHVLHGSLRVGDDVSATVDTHLRQSVALNHSATHLLHAALRKLLGDHVTQKGSLVDSERLRFDFSHFEQIKLDQLKAIETLVNDQIRANTPVVIEDCDMDEAKS